MLKLVCDNGTAVEASDHFFIRGASGALTSASGNTVFLEIPKPASPTSFFNWNVVTSADNIVQIEVQNGYICDGVSLVVFLLPLAPIIGDMFIIISNTARFQINENGSQQLCIGTAAATAGSGNLTSNSTGDKIEFVYVGGNIFRGFAPQGTVTLT